MWVEAAFSPDAFWHQSPRTFQLAMRGLRKRLTTDAENRLEHAWSVAGFTGAAQAGKLKPFRHYLKKAPRKMSNSEMLGNMKMLAARVNRKFEGE